MRLFLCGLSLVVALVVGGCGSGASDGGLDPATLVPADSAVYLEAVVRPDGDQGDAVKSFAGKLLRTSDPGAEIRDLVDKGIRESGTADTTFEDDIDPWLGDRIGMGLSDLSGEEPRFIVVIATRDAELAAERVAEEAEDEKARKVSDGDVTYWIDKDGEVAGVVGEALVVAGDEASFKRAMAAEDGKHLAGTERFEQALDDLPDERIGLFYLDTPRFFDAAMAGANGDPAAAQLLKSFTGELKPAGAALVAGEDTLTIETATEKAKSSSLLSAFSGGATPLLRELPAGSWGAMGVPDLGAGAKTIFGQLGGALGGAFIGGQLQQLGIDLDRDVFGWIGDVALFARGDSVAAIRGGAVIEVTDRDLAAQAIPKLIGLARQQGDIPFEPVRIPGAELAFAARQPGMADAVVVALGGDRAVITYGEDAAADALEPDQTLEQDGTYGRAKDATGGLDPTLLFEAPAIVKLIAESATEKEFAEAKPYLDTIDLFAAGSEEDGDKVRQRFVVKLR